MDVGFLLHRDGCAARNARVLCPCSCDECQHSVEQTSAENARNGNREHNVGECLEDVGGSHEQTVHAPAVVAREHSNQAADRARCKDDEERCKDGRFSSGKNA